MNRVSKCLVVVVMLFASPLQLFAQYLNTLHDCDSSFDWGMNIFRQIDGRYFVFGMALNQRKNIWGIFNLNISSDGKVVLLKKQIKLDSFSIYLGDPGSVRMSSGREYIAPITFQGYADGIFRSSAGILKYDAFGDSMFLKTYTDTTTFLETANQSAITHDGGYLIGGQRGSKFRTTHAVALLTRTDSLGDTLWTHTYQKFADQSTMINSIIPLADGRIIIGAQSTYYVSAYTAYNHDSPWFIELDSLGNILKDTLYGSSFGGGGEIYTDSHGGYVHSGGIDTLLTADPTALENFPYYIAHLDTNFRIEWLTRFPYNSTFGHRYTDKVIQLRDGKFIVGQEAVTYGGHPVGWAAKVDRSGTILWNHFYTNGANHDAYFRDVVENPDGSLVFTGMNGNDSTPRWHTTGDVWLLGVDSKGCETPGCGPGLWPDAVTDPTEVHDFNFALIPNPTTGVLQVTVTEAGTFTVYAVDGKLISTYSVAAGNTSLTLPVTLAPGLYLGNYKSASGSHQKVNRFVYQP